ncbi:MAG TPA: MFS transporter, partial [Micavibrio sp.]|nr:MFS transporter [Micavibrio sp.]
MTDAEQQPKQDQGDMLAARKAALLMLGEILDRKQPLDQVLEQTREFTALPQRDRGFVRMLVTTTLRRLGQVDDFINKSLTQAEPLRPPALRNLLRLGATQIAFMNVPDYAIVDTSVRIAEKNNLSRQKGLVNAVLRRIADEHKDWEKKQDAARINTPEWLMKIWIEDYGLR